MNLFYRASKNLHLSPEERAFLRAVKGLALAALVVGAEYFYRVLAGSGPVNWGAIFLHTVLLVGFTFFESFLHYLSSLRDPGLPAALQTPEVQQLAAVGEQLVTQAATRFGVNDGAQGPLPVTSQVPAVQKTGAAG